MLDIRESETGEGERWASERQPRASAASAADAGASFDSTTSHIPPLQSEGYKLYVPLGGSMCKLKGKNSSSKPPKPGIRGKAGFSPRSRKRLLQLVASLDQDTRPPLFLGLTYPGQSWPSSPVVWHGDLESFYKRLCRKYPMCNIAVLWRLEPQHRGAPHFHLLVFGVPYIPYQWVGAAWADITSGDAARCSLVERDKSCRGGDVLR